MKQKLVSPNGNYEVAICRNCGEEYIKRLNNSTKQLAPGIRGWRMKNCSKKCTMESKHRTCNADKANNSHPSVKRNKIEARGDASLSKQEANK